MARPRKNNVDYFSHDNNMRNDEKVLAVRRRFGFNGYAVWVMCLEKLYGGDNFQIKIQNEVDLELLAGDFLVEPNLLQEIIDYFVHIDLLQKKGNIYFSKEVNRRVKPILEERKRGREYVNRRWKHIKKGVIGVDNDTKKELSMGETIQSKVKESKDIYTQSDFVSKDYIGQLRKEERRDLRIIGLYFEEAKMEFPSKEAAEKELKRWLKTAKTLKDYSDEKILKAFKIAKTKHKELWKLSTVEKEIPSVK